MSKIVQVGDNVLRGTASEVPVEDIPGPKIQGIIKDMRETLAAEPDGAALAAPQIGVPLRIFVISERVFGPDSDHVAASKDPHFVYINPVITKHSKRLHVVDEGCLSVRGQYGNIERYTNATIEAYDEHGQKFTRGAGGLLAQAFQHETDHLDGTLFTDDALETWEVDMHEHGKPKK
jgi:peptide deformylase